MFMHGFIMWSVHETSLSSSADALCKAFVKVNLHLDHNIETEPA